MPESYPKIYLCKRIVQAKLFMDAHFGDAIDLGNIADEAFFSKFHFIRLFKAVYGRTPHQYLMGVRMERAQVLLEKGHSVAETCFSVGFDSVSSFAGLFRRYARMSPSDYRQRYTKRREQMEQTPLLFIPNCFAERKGWTENSNFGEVG